MTTSTTNLGTPAAPKAPRVVRPKATLPKVAGKAEQVAAKAATTADRAAARAKKTVAPLTAEQILTGLGKFYNAALEGSKDHNHALAVLATFEDTRDAAWKATYTATLSRNVRGKDIAAKGAEIAGNASDMVKQCVPTNDPAVSRQALIGRVLSLPVDRDKAGNALPVMITDSTGHELPMRGHHVRAMINKCTGLGLPKALDAAKTQGDAWKIIKAQADDPTGEKAVKRQKSAADRKAQAKVDADRKDAEDKLTASLKTRTGLLAQVHIMVTGALKMSEPVTSGEAQQAEQIMEMLMTLVGAAQDVPDDASELTEQTAS